MQIQFVPQHRSQFASRRHLSLVTTPHHISKPAHTLQIGQQGLNRQFLKARRQSHLNNGYNIRKQRLQEITVENRKIYAKINAQKSMYSRSILRKSYESNASLSRMLSESKISRRSASQSSMKSSHVKKKKETTFTTKNKPKYQIQVNSVKSIKTDEINKLKNIFNCQDFKNTQSMKPIKAPHLSKRLKKYRHLSNEIENIPNLNIVQIKKKLGPDIMSTRVPLKSLNSNDGSFLHKIAQQMFQDKIKK